VVNANPPRGRSEPSEPTARVAAAGRGKAADPGRRAPAAIAGPPRSTQYAGSGERAEERPGPPQVAPIGHAPIISRYSRCVVTGSPSDRPYFSPRGQTGR